MLLEPDELMVVLPGEYAREVPPELVFIPAVVHGAVPLTETVPDTLTDKFGTSLTVSEWLPTTVCAITVENALVPPATPPVPLTTRNALSFCVVTCVQPTGAAACQNSMTLPE